MATFALTTISFFHNNQLSDFEGHSPIEIIKHHVSVVYCDKHLLCLLHKAYEALAYGLSKSKALKRALDAHVARIDD